MANYAGAESGPGELGDLISLLEDGPSADIPELVLEPVQSPQGDETSDPDDWRTDPVAVKLEKIRSVFLNSKTPFEVRAAAASMPIGLWLEQVVRLMPKDVKVQGEVNFRHMLEGLGPIDKDAYRLSGRSAQSQLVEDVSYQVLDD